MMDFYDKTVHIVYASDNHFSEILGVSLISLFENSKDIEEIIVYLLDSGIEEDSRKRIESIFVQYHRKQPYWIKAKNISRELTMEVDADRGSLSQYARLFVSSVLPDYLGRVLYLDCDIIIRYSIKELWDIDMHGKTISASVDAFSKYYRTNIDLQPNDIMFNSGVMLIDLIRWKELKVETRLLDFIVSKKGKIQQGDQGALNAVLSHDIYCFEPCYNSVSIYYDFTFEEMLVYRKPPRFYTKEQIQRAVDEPRIIHFTTSFLSKRPWVKGCVHPYVSEWLKYKSMSPWRDVVLWEEAEPTGLVGIYIKFAKRIPRRLLIELSGILQAYGRPVVNYLKANIHIR